MTHLTSVKSGPAFREPRSLVEQLQASVDYNSEKQRQEELPACVDPDTLPSDEQLKQVHGWLNGCIGGLPTMRADWFK